MTKKLTRISSVCVRLADKGHTAPRKLYDDRRASIQIRHFSREGLLKTHWLHHVESMEHLVRICSKTQQEKLGTYLLPKPRPANLKFIPYKIDLPSHQKTTVFGALCIMVKSKGFTLLKTKEYTLSWKWVSGIPLNLWFEQFSCISRIQYCLNYCIRTMRTVCGDPYIVLFLYLSSRSSA